MLDKKESFSEKCWDALNLIPKGKVTTYSELAKHLNTKAFRAVGTAVGKNPGAPKVPCHRVVRKDGTVGGYAFGTNKKIKLLKSEGIKIKKDKIEDFDLVYFEFSSRKN
ncbi:UNVERIFIED_CONTAM: hypothetical protein GTU68_045338 [Idotea baltica]|nr:hypothetical protein [Idotea baltica]